MKPKLILIFITILSLSLRFANLTQFPVSLSMDETAIGFNAYSILKTGRDEWGAKFPLAFKSAGDYKPPVNVYLTSLSIAAFGYTEFAIRFPSALLGALTPLIFYFLLKRLKAPSFSCLFAAFWLAVLPWHIHFSRASFEAVTGLFFLIFGIERFLHYLDKHHSTSLYLSLAFLSLSVWAYHAQRLFTPLIFIALLIIYRPQLKIIKRRQLIISLAILSFFAIPFIKLTFFSPAILTRASSTSILREASLARSLRSDYPDIKTAIFDNNIYKIFRHWAGKYLNYFDIFFWFQQGLKFTPPDRFDIGLILLADLFFLAGGIVYFVKQKNSPLKKLTLAWFFLGPLPASLTMNEQHPLRSLVWVPAFGFIIALGFDQIRKKFRKIYFLYLPLLLINLIYFANIYTQHFPYFSSEYWGYGYKQLSQYACQNIDKYDKIYISDTFGSYGPLNTGLPYLYYLTYCQSDPQKFLDNHRQIDKIFFQRPDWKNYQHQPNLLLIGSSWDFLGENHPEPKQIIKTIKFKNQKDAFLLVQTSSP